MWNRSLNCVYGVLFLKTSLDFFFFFDELKIVILFFCLIIISRKFVSSPFRDKCFSNLLHVQR